MRNSKKSIITITILFIIIFVLMTYELPYYVYKPGLADRLDDIVEIEDGYPAEGQLHLLTVSGSRATPMEYVAAKFLPYHDIETLEEARPEGITDEEYMFYQLHMMEDSKQSSIYVAYEAAGKEVHLQNDGIQVVRVVAGMPAEGMVQLGDKVLQVDGRRIEETTDLVDYVQTKQAGDYIELHIEREGSRMDKEVEVVTFPEKPDTVGIGIQLVKNKTVDVDPPVNIKSGNIGGPSAGLMFSLEMYNQLTENDITRGYNIAGTGTINEKGNVGSIGGIDKKVVAANKEKAEIFFAPYEEGAENSNYEDALETAKDIKSNMKIVPVDTFDEALEYLEELEKHT